MKIKNALLTLTFLLAAILITGCSKDNKKNPLEPLRDAEQITLNSQDVTIVTTGIPVSYLNISDISIPQGGEDQEWDYREVSVDSSGMDTWMPVPANPAFPNSVTAYTSGYGLLMFVLPALEYVQKNEEFYQQPGFTISAMRIDLIAGTSFIDVPQQIVTYNPVRKSLHFPMAYGNLPDVFESCSQEIIGNITHPLMNFNNTPVGYKVTQNRTNTISGWGVLALPTLDEQFDVLLVKADVTYKDDIFINGTLAPQELLTLFGLTQGNTYQSTRYQFYAKGNPQPVLTIFVQNNQITFAQFLQQAKNG